MRMRQAAATLHAPFAVPASVGILLFACLRPVRRPAPSRQVSRVLAPRQIERFLQRLIEIPGNILRSYPPAQEIGPQEFAERWRVLVIAAGKTQFAGKRAVGVVDQIFDRFWNV